MEMEDNQKEINLWEDEDFLNEMKSRMDDYESGKDVEISWEEVKQKLRDRNTK
jgi:putative addiction module component (TIGR02574 family)